VYLIDWRLLLDVGGSLLNFAHVILSRFCTKRNDSREIKSCKAESEGLNSSAVVESFKIKFVVDAVNVPADIAGIP